MIRSRGILSVLAAFGLLAMGSASHAVVLSVGDANYVGLINDGIPANPANEVGYINTLTTLAAGAGDTVIGSETYNRVSSLLAGPFDAAVLANAGKDDTGGTTINLADSYQYFLGKYDAGRAGSLVWYFADGLSGEITLPGTLNGLGLSHIAWYNLVDGDDDDDQDVPEPGTLALLGLGLIGLGIGRRWTAKR